MKNELSDALAIEIRDCHARAENTAKAARGNIDAALHAAANVGILIDKARDQHRGRLHEWLREYVPTLPPEQADIYYGIHKVRQRRECLEADSRQLKLIGIIGDPSVIEDGGSSTTARANGSKWVKWASHIVLHFKEVDKARPIETWEGFERNALVDTLEPMVALWKRAGGVL